MEIHMIEQKTYAVMTSRFKEFAENIESLCRESGIDNTWLDNQEVCQVLKISKRTLQYYRDSGKIPFSHISHKCYYKVSDVEELIAKNHKK